MPELRKDPVVGRWVIMATERGPGLSEAALEVFSAAVRQPTTGERTRIPDAATGQG